MPHGVTKSRTQPNNWTTITNLTLAGNMSGDQDTGKQKDKSKQKQRGVFEWQMMMATVGAKIRLEKIK